MNQITVSTCPACKASAGQTKGFTCPRCRLPFAFVSMFAGPEAITYQHNQIQAIRAQRFQTLQERYSDGLSFMLADRCVLCLDKKTHTLNLYFADGQTETIEDVLQYSRSRKHTLILHTDGTVEARGSNDCGQCVVTDLRDVASVLAGPNSSYCVDRKGSVIVRGDGRLQADVEKWSNIRRLAVGDHHLVGLRTDGRVNFTGSISAPKVFRSTCDWKNITAIAATSDYALALDQDGRVYFAGYPEDERQAAAKWESIAAIAAEDIYAVALTKDGRVLLAGEDGCLDRGRSEAARWNKVVAIAAAGGGIGGIAENGSLYLCGESFAPTTNRGNISQRWMAGQPLINHCD